MAEGYYRDEGWQFAIADPDEEARQEAALPEALRGTRQSWTKAQWLEKGDHLTARNPDGSTVSVPTETLRDLPDDAHIILRRQVFRHPNADPILRDGGSDKGETAATGELVITFRKSGGPSIRWSAAESGDRPLIEAAAAALQRLLHGDALERLDDDERLDSPE